MKRFQGLVSPFVIKWLFSFLLVVLVSQVATLSDTLAYVMESSYEESFSREAFSLPGKIIEKNMDDLQHLNDGPVLLNLNAVLETVQIFLVREVNLLAVPSENSSEGFFRLKAIDVEPKERIPGQFIGEAVAFSNVPKGFRTSVNYLCRTAGKKNRPKGEMRFGKNIEDLGRGRIIHDSEGKYQGVVFWFNKGALKFHKSLIFKASFQKVVYDREQSLIFVTLKSRFLRMWRLKTANIWIFPLNESFNGVIDWDPKLSRAKSLQKRSRVWAKAEQLSPTP